MIERSKIIFIHGASSSGKSTLARAVQAQLDEPFWHVSIDHLRDSGMVPMERFRRGDFRWRDYRARFFDGFHRSLVAYASAGNNLLLEHILEEPQWAPNLALMLQPFDVFFVGLHCELDELVRRETLRADRPIGSAADDFHRIHEGAALRPRTSFGAVCRRERCAAYVRMGVAPRAIRFRGTCAGRAGCAHRSVSLTGRI